MGIRILFTMKPGLSREMHTVLPKCSDSAFAVPNTYIYPQPRCVFDLVQSFMHSVNREEQYLRHV